MNGEGTGQAATARGHRRALGGRQHPASRNPRNGDGGKSWRHVWRAGQYPMFAALLIAAVAIPFCTTVPVAAAEPPAAWSFRPYRVTVVVALPRIAELPPTEHRAWCEAFAARLESAYAPLWDTTVVAADVGAGAASTKNDGDATVAAATVAAAEKLLVENPALLSPAAARSIARAWPSAAKVIFLSIEARDDHFRAIAREYDADVGFLGPIEQREAASPAVLPGTAAAAVTAAFSPQARFESLPNGSLTLRPRGAQLRTREPLPGWSEGDVARLFLRPTPISTSSASEQSTEGSEGIAQTTAAGDAAPAASSNPKDRSADEAVSPVEPGEADASSPAAVAIPWTAAVLSEVGSKGLVAQVVTRLENPFDETRGLGIERLALRAGRQGRATTLRLVAADSAAAEYAVFDVGDPKQPVCLGLTDRVGRFVVPAGKSVLRCLALSDGKRVVTEFPLIADGAAEMEIPLAQALTSLGVELFLLPARNALIDELARRAGPVARIEALLASMQWDKADQLLAEMKKLPSGKTWAAELMLRLGKPPGADARVIARLDAFRNEAQQALDKQLGSERLSQWEKRIAEGRKPPEPPEGQTDPDAAASAPNEGGTTPDGSSPPNGSAPSGSPPSEEGSPTLSP